MSYRWPESVGLEIPADNPIPDPQIYTGLALFTLLLGLLFVVVGRRGRQWWLLIWGAMLGLVSIAFIVAIRLGYG